MRSIEDRMLAFVAWHGALPRDAKKIDDDQARQHVATWLRRDAGRSSPHVVGFARGNRWWTFFFERLDRLLASNGAEVWTIEGYGGEGESWSGQYYYWPESNRWRHVFHAVAGEDYGRQPGVPRGGEPT